MLRKTLKCGKIEIDYTDKIMYIDPDEFWMSTIDDVTLEARGITEAKVYYDGVECQYDGKIIFLIRSHH